MKASATGFWKTSDLVAFIIGFNRYVQRKTPEISDSVALFAVILAGLQRKLRKMVDSVAYSDKCRLKVQRKSQEDLIPVACLLSKRENEQRKSRTIAFSLHSLPGCGGKAAVVPDEVKRPHAILFPCRGGEESGYCRYHPGPPARSLRHLSAAPVLSRNPPRHWNRRRVSRRTWLPRR